MSEHTPGPWKIGSTDKGHNANLITDNCGDSVAQVYGIPSHTMLSDVDERWANGIANARLIAAAPDMLDVLRFVLTDPCFSKLGFITQDRVRDVIAIATGEQQ